MCIRPQKKKSINKRKISRNIAVENYNFSLQMNDNLAYLNSTVTNVQLVLTVLFLHSETNAL